MGDPETEWHLNKSIPLSILAFLVVQAVTIIVWATRLDSRVGILESNDTYQSQRLQRLEELTNKISVIEERQLNSIARLDIQTKTMQEILAVVSKFKKD